MPGEFTALISAFGYALSYIFLRRGQQDTTLPDNGLLPILTISGLILVLANVLAFIHHTLPAPLATVPLKGLLYSMVGGIIATLLGRLALYRTIQRVGATRGVVVKGFAPVVTMLVAVIFFHETLQNLDVFGILVLLFGIALLLVEQVLHPFRSITNRIFQNSIFLGILAAILQGVGHALRKPAVAHGAWPLLAATVDLAAASIVYILILCLQGRFTALFVHYRTTLNVYLVASAITSAIAVLCFFLAISQTSLSVVSVIVGTEPIFVALLSLVFFRTMEQLTIYSAIASVIVALGIVLISW